MSSIETSEHKLLLSIAYDEKAENWKDQINSLLTTTFPEVAVQFFHEGKLKERRKAFMLKGGYSARKSPFAVIFDIDKNPLKAFYSEVEECTLENISWYLDFFLTQLKQNENESSNS